MPKIIDTLTPEHEARRPEFREKWTKIMVATEKCNRVEAKKWMDVAYRQSGLEPPTETFWVASPQAIVDLAQSMMGKDGDYFDDIIKGMNYGNHEASFLSFYEFFYKACDCPEVKPLVPQFKIAEYANWWLPFDDCIIACERPTKIHVEGPNLHADLEPSVVYADGFGEWTLHGISVPEDIVMTPAEELDVKLVLKEKNVDVRREIVRKIGYDRLYKELGGETIEKIAMTKLYEKYPILSYEQQGDVIFKPEKLEVVTYNELSGEFKKSIEGKFYSLVMMVFGDDNKRPFLVMDNLSVDAIHVEGVPPDITSVFDAICFRNQMNGLPQELK